MQNNASLSAVNKWVSVADPLKRREEPERSTSPESMFLWLSDFPHSLLSSWWYGHGYMRQGTDLFELQNSSLSRLSLFNVQYWKVLWENRYLTQLAQKSSFSYSFHFNFLFLLSQLSCH